MRDFYIYGFKSRNEFQEKSARSYDNERRRVESWLSEYISFRKDSKGKQYFFSVDGRNIPHNPLYKAYKAKSFTDNDIILHFYILDILAQGEKLSFRDIVEKIFNDYLSFFDTDILPDESTIRNKLKEYVKLGIIKGEKCGKEIIYSKIESTLNDEGLIEAIGFATEENPVGAIGSFIMDKYPEASDIFSFKHRHLSEALEQNIIVNLLICIKNGAKAEINVKQTGLKKTKALKVFPLKIYVSCQNGRQYLLAYCYDIKRPRTIRIDSIVKVKEAEKEPEVSLYNSYGEKYSQYLWGVSDARNRKDKGRKIEHLEMTVYIEDDEKHVLRRLEREKRGGKISILDAHRIKFEADVYDAGEMIPWVRSFTGRVEEFKCSNAALEKRFNEDLESLYSIYGGTADDIQ